MINPVIWLAIPTFVFSLVIMWLTFSSMVDKRSIRNFLPFFLLSFVLSFYAGAIVFEVFFDALWMVLELSIFLSLVWVLVNIWRRGLC